MSTLEAELADPRRPAPTRAEAVRSGRLVRALSYAGVGPVELAGGRRGPHEAAGRLDHAVKRASGRTAAAAASQEAESAVTAAQSVVPATQDAAEHARRALDALRRP